MIQFWVLTYSFKNEEKTYSKELGRQKNKQNAEFKRLVFEVALLAKILEEISK